MVPDDPATANRLTSSDRTGVDKLTLVFLGHTRELVSAVGADGTICSPGHRRASIKDIIEAHGVPHTEVGRIVCDGRECRFNFIPAEGDIVVIFPFDHTTPIHEPTVLRPQPLYAISFLADLTLGKLVRNLRLAGIDTEMAKQQQAHEIVLAANVSQRILLSRNRNLLKIGQVTYGQLIRSPHHSEQMLEVMRRFSLRGAAKPLSRCLACNRLLESVDKHLIQHQLEPLTQRYYHQFSRCGNCGRVYWQGTHYAKLQELLHTWL